jgi:hypothetical protein
VELSPLSVKSTERSAIPNTSVVHSDAAAHTVTYFSDVVKVMMIFNVNGGTFSFGFNFFKTMF